MKKILIMISLLSFINCKEQFKELPLRSACYEKMRCKNAVEDCIVGTIFLKTLLSEGSSSTGNTTSSQNSFTNTLINPIYCMGADVTCEEECDKKNKI